MKTFSVLSLAVAASLVMAAESATLEEMFIKERRFTLFNSRQLSGECCKLFFASIQFSLLFTLGTIMILTDMHSPLTSLRSVHL